MYKFIILIILKIEVKTLLLVFILKLFHCPMVEVVIFPFQAVEHRYILLFSDQALNLFLLFFFTILKKRDEF